MKRRTWWIWVVIACGLAAAVAVSGLGERVASRIAGSRDPQDVVEIPAVTVERRDIVRTITATGNVQPIREVDLRFSENGRIREVLVVAGQRVEAGDVLAVQDNRAQELAYFQAQNAYEAARIDSPPNTVRAREIDMELAREALEQTYLRAPFSGVVTDVYVEPGQSVNANDVVVHLVDDSAFQVEVAVDELDIAEVQPGQTAMIRLDADPERVREGVVERVSLVADVQGGVVTVPVIVRFQKTDPFLRSGYTATVDIVVAEAQGVPAVPVEAIWEQDGVRTVTRVNGDRQEAVPVTTGLSDGSWVEITSGVEVGDRVVAVNYRGGPAAAVSPAAGRGFGPPPGGFPVRVMPRR
ncbi:MAG: efflux RND transporter periplasmic adaptor subunit [Firmicutes bacterium]|nr:efflux RND transporter periplasmic adaptor subunit [Bacillota bacterium]